MQLHWYAPSKGLCCEYCVLIAHCVGYCEKIPFFFFFAVSATLPR